MTSAQYSDLYRFSGKTSVWIAEIFRQFFWRCNLTKKQPTQNLKEATGSVKMRRQFVRKLLLKWAKKIETFTPFFPKYSALDQKTAYAFKTSNPGVEISKALPLRKVMNIFCSFDINARQHQNMTRKFVNL